MFLVNNILNKFKFAINPMKFATNCDKSALFNNLLTNTRMVNNIILQKHECCKSQPFLTFWERKLACLALTSSNLLV